MELNELPGAELILLGLEDLYNGRNHTIGSLLIAIASTRLSVAGLDIPQVSLVSEPELALYAHLQQVRTSDAYSYYNALLNSLNSFCAALELKSKYHKVSALELVTGVPIVYDLDVSGEAIAKKILND